MSLDYFEEMKEMVRCTQLYYRQQKQQREIASEMNISASKVSRLLKRAAEEGFIRVDFNFPPLPHLAARLIEKKGLRDAVVIPSGLPNEIKEEIGIAAARYFERVAGDGAKVGLSCGFTLYYMIKHLRESLVNNLKIYPLAAESTYKSVDIIPNTLVGMMAAKYRPHVNAYALPANLAGRLDRGSPERGVFLESPEVIEIFDDAHNVDVALVGVGAVDPSTPGFCAVKCAEGISPHQLTSLGAVGEFNYQPIDRDGQEVKDTAIDERGQRIWAVPLNRLRQMATEHGKYVIAIGGGMDKVEAVSAVLKGRLCNVLITDQDVAEALLKE